MLKAGAGTVDPAEDDVASLAPLWLPTLALAAAVAAGDRGTDGGDVLFFVHAGERLFGAAGPTSSQIRRFKPGRSSSRPWAVSAASAARRVLADRARRRGALLAAGLAAVAMRLLLDPALYSAYLLAPLVLVLAGAAELLTGSLVRGSVEARLARTRARVRTGQAPAASRR